MPGGKVNRCLMSEKLRVAKGFGLGCSQHGEKNHASSGRRASIRSSVRRAGLSPEVTTCGATVPDDPETWPTTTGSDPPEVSVQPLLAQLRKDAKGKGEEKYVAVLPEIVRANPEDTFSWNQLGIWHYRKNQLDEAAGHFEKALEADDEYIPALNNLAGVYYQRRQYDKAIGICRRILEIDPKSVRTRVNLGRAYYLQGEKEKARNQWRKALEIAPNDAEARSCLRKLQ